MQKKQTLKRSESVAFCGLAIALSRLAHGLRCLWVLCRSRCRPWCSRSWYCCSPRAKRGKRCWLLLFWALLACRCSRAWRAALRRSWVPRGGFIIGFVLGAVAAALVLKAWKVPSSKALGLVREYVAAFAFLAISYVCGWAQLMAVAGMSPMAAFLAGIAPFILLDAIKIVIGVSLAHALRQAVPALRRATHKRRSGNCPGNRFGREWESEVALSKKESPF